VSNKTDTVRLYGIYRKMHSRSFVETPIFKEKGVERETANE